jgi:hypothetical protein
MQNPDGQKLRKSYKENARFLPTKKCIMQISAKLCRFLQISANLCRILQISADFCKFMQISAKLCKFLQANFCKFLQISANFCRCLQIYANLCKILQNLVKQKNSFSLFQKCTRRPPKNTGDVKSAAGQATGKPQLLNTVGACSMYSLCRQGRHTQRANTDSELCSSRATNCQRQMNKNRPASLLPASPVRHRRIVDTSPSQCSGSAAAFRVLCG